MPLMIVRAWFGKPSIIKHEDADPHARMSRALANRDDGVLRLHSDLGCANCRSGILSMREVASSRNNTAAHKAANAQRDQRFGTEDSARRFRRAECVTRSSNYEFVGIRRAAASSIWVQRQVAPLSCFACDGARRNGSCVHQPPFYGSVRQHVHAIVARGIPFDSRLGPTEAS